MEYFRTEKGQIYADFAYRQVYYRNSHKGF